ncbi:MAG: dihydrofolate synthase/folylpolyglutamate synthase [Hyphomicrobiaceae bacterium]|jgi:dihydrofolate synthase/folylpolyglutamate synthase
MDFRLERLEPVLKRLGSPQLRLPVVHIAGTNGKGSVAAMLESVWRAAGFHTGLYTSPHLLSFCERIRLDGKSVLPDDVVDLVARVRVAMEAEDVDLTFFEIATLAALLAMDEAGVDVAVLETGLGGRLDATNVCKAKLATVITSIARDHAEYLGDDLSAIATEKAGIFAAGCPAFTGVTDLNVLDVLDEQARRAGTTLAALGRDFDDAETPAPGLIGEHQKRNAALVAAVVRELGSLLPVGESDLSAGLADARWPGRFERVADEPTVIVDCAHNPAAVDALVETLEAAALDAPMALVFSAMADKEWPAMLDRLVPHFSAVVLAPLAMPRALKPSIAAAYLDGALPVHLAESATAALARARRLVGAAGTIVVAGSIFLVAEVYADATGTTELFKEPDLAA